MANPDTPYLISDIALPCFEMAAEEAFADFFAAAYAITDGPLEGVRVLAAIRDYEIESDADDVENELSSTYKAAQDVKASNALKPRITFIGSGYKRGTALDFCSLEILIVVNLKHHSRSLYSQIVNHVRAALSMANISQFVSDFNEWTGELGATGYKFHLQGLTAPTDAGTNGLDDTSIVCRMKYNLSGCFLAVP